MGDVNTGKTYRHWPPEVAFHVWQHHASVGGADKDRMIQIATLLLGFSAGIVGFAFKDAVKGDKICEPAAVACLSMLGVIVSFASALITLLYGGYANRNWAKADQIAFDYKWERLYPSDSPFAGMQSGRPSRRVAWALRHSGPKATHKQLAPVFEWFFGLSLVSLMVHLGILFWSICSLSGLIVGCS